MKPLSSLSAPFRIHPTMSIRSSIHASHACDALNRRGGLNKELSAAGDVKATLVRYSPLNHKDAHAFGSYFVSPDFNLVGVSGDRT